mmetsp:Transcript_22249/g.48888  ORF Transcript_22249/g.48888 Transcript_22249/m.48888 type:complete len:204 (-) Transcript_22249:145-756(-)
MVLTGKKSCHKCAGALEKAHASAVAHCSVCHTGYHTVDCGMRYLAAGLDEETLQQCPKCNKLCACSGGEIPCHTANVRLRGAAKKRRERTEDPSTTNDQDVSKSGASEGGVESSAGKAPIGPLPYVSQLEGPSSSACRTKRLRQSKVPNVVGQLIQANAALREQVKHLQNILNQCKCRQHASLDLQLTENKADGRQDPLDLRL